MENIKELFAEWGLWSLVEDISDDGDGTGDNLQLTKEGSEAQRMIDQELDKAREEVRREVLKEVEYTLAKDTRYEFRFTEIKEVLSKLKDNK